MKLDFNKHYVNKTRTKHYYLGHTFTNKEWALFIDNKKVHDAYIPGCSKYRLPPECCERYYNQDNNSTSIARPCPNKPFYRCDQHGRFFCKYCARQIDKVNDKLTFSKILPKQML
jgi:hypothetical protein